MRWEMRQEFFERYTVEINEDVWSQIRFTGVGIERTSRSDIGRVVAWEILCKDEHGKTTGERAAFGRCTEDGEYVEAMIALAEREGLWIDNIDVVADHYGIEDVPESVKAPKEERAGSAILVDGRDITDEIRAMKDMGWVISQVNEGSDVVSVAFSKTVGTYVFEIYADDCDVGPGEDDPPVVFRWCAEELHAEESAWSGEFDQLEAWSVPTEALDNLKEHMRNDAGFVIELRPEQFEAAFGEPMEKQEATKPLDARAAEVRNHTIAAKETSFVSNRHQDNRDAVDQGARR
jgi:hypothetical protein